MFLSISKKIGDLTFGITLVHVFVHLHPLYKCLTEFKSNYFFVPHCCLFCVAMCHIPICMHLKDG